MDSLFAWLVLHCYKQTCPELGSQASVPGGLEWGLSTHAGEPSSPSQGLPDWGPDSPDEADGAPGPDEQVGHPPSSSSMPHADQNEALF